MLVNYHIYVKIVKIAIEVINTLGFEEIVLEDILLVDIFFNKEVGNGIVLDEKNKILLVV